MSLEKMKFICALYQKENWKDLVFNLFEVLKYIATTLHSPLSYRIDVMIGR